MKGWVREEARSHRTGRSNKSSMAECKLRGQKKQKTGRMAWLSSHAWGDARVDRAKREIRLSPDEDL